jgi:hypothetical protein
MIMSNITARRATVWNTRLIRTTERKPPLARGHRKWLDLPSRDRNPKGGDREHWLRAKHESAISSKGELYT